MAVDESPGRAEDSELARRIAAGSAPDAERELATRFARRIRLYGLRYLRNEDRAAELVQEVLLIVIDALRTGRVEEVEHIDRFMLGTCRNVVSGWHRGERRRADLAATLGSAPGAGVAQPPPPPEAGRLWRCLRSLALREQTVLLLTFCQEYEAEEIGRVLDISTTHVRVIRHRALKAVKECLGQGGMR